MKNAYMLIGLPGSGKSTWAEDFLDHHLGTAVKLSTDDYIERVAAAQGKTYSEVFSAHMGAADAALKTSLEEAAACGKNIIWDQTNLTPTGRRVKVAHLRALGYDVYAIVFKVPFIVLSARLTGRPGKIIPDHVLQSMISSYVEPSLDEGFVWIADITHDEEGKSVVALRIP